ncbi:MAG: FAD-dependent monooxygenase, partial [Desulfobacterales bacterium]|nr:FAD-dependent monooxygenase [Desulfobacterales bacterium]
MPHQAPIYPFQRAPEQDGRRVRHPVIIVGAGPVGLSAAIDLKVRGIPVLVIDDDNTTSEGSRAIAWAKRTLEIWDRMGSAERIKSKGVGWELGKVFYRQELLYQFTMKANESQKMPPFVNLQQYYVEEYLIDKCRELEIEIRWQTRLADVTSPADGPVSLSLETPQGSYQTECDWLIAADGARSQVRKSLGLGFKGQVFNERFLIMDIRMLSDYPAERWFWFDP